MTCGAMRCESLTEGALLSVAHVEQAKKGGFIRAYGGSNLGLPCGAREC